MATYRIEKRIDGQATEYWDAASDTWDMDAEMATVYSEMQRTASLEAGIDWGLEPPTGGIWVRLDDDKSGIKDLPLTVPPYAPESPSQYQQRMQSVSPFTVQHLAIVRRAVAQVIDEGDPATPRVGGKPVWSTDWQLYAAGKAESFVEAVAQRVFELATRGDDGNRKERS